MDAQTTWCSSPSQNFVSKSIRHRLHKDKNVVVVVVVAIIVVVVAIVAISGTMS